MSRTLSDCTLKIDGSAWAYVPNSLVTTPGNPERTAVVSTVGNGVKSVGYSEDISTAFGVVKFDMRVTADNIKKIKKVVSGTHTIEIPDLNEAYSQMFLVTKFEQNLQHEGVISLEFHGNSVV